MAVASAAFKRSCAAGSGVRTNRAAISTFAALGGGWNG